MYLKLSEFRPVGVSAALQKCVHEQTGVWRVCLEETHTDIGVSLPACVIGKIPAEILCKIFSQVLNVQLSPSVPSHVVPFQRNSELLQITAVCSYWRSTALGYAVLWTIIAFSTSGRSSIRTASLFLSRSKSAMLSVHIWDSGRTKDSWAMRASRKLLHYIASQNHRLSSCELSSTSPEFWKYWTIPAPNLRRLVVRGEGFEAGSIFGGEIPLLGTFAASCGVPWALGNYASLREADIRNKRGIVTLSSLLDSLKGCKKLEKLSLFGFTQPDSMRLPQATPVSLPNLRQIDIFSSDSALILEYLEAPSLTGLVTITDTNPHNHILFPLPRNQLKPPYMRGIKILHLVLDTHSMQHYITGSREDGSTAFYIGACGIGYWLRRSWVQASIEAVAACTHFFRVNSLIFATDATEVPWDLWLPNLSHIQELNISCPRPEDLLSALISHPSSNGLPLCPSLNSIALRRRGKHLAVDRGLMKSLVLSRYLEGRPIRKLKLQRDEWDMIRHREKIRQRVLTQGSNESWDRLL